MDSAQENEWMLGLLRAFRAGRVILTASTLILSLTIALRVVLKIVIWYNVSMSLHMKLYLLE